MRIALLGSLAALGVGVGIAAAAEPETAPAPKVMTSAAPAPKDAPPPPPDAGPGPGHAPGTCHCPSCTVWGRCPPCGHGGPDVPGAAHPAGPCACGGEGCDRSRILADLFEGSFGGYGSGTRFYFAAEYLLWWFKSDNVPPLVTTGPATFPVAVLGARSTGVLSSRILDEDSHSGVRLRAGYWLDCEQSCGIEVSGFLLGRETHNQNFTSGSAPVLARPFFNINSGAPAFTNLAGPASEFAAFPGLATGSIRVANNSNFGGFNADVRHACWCSCWYRIDALAGFDYLNLREDLKITENGTNSTSPLIAPNLRGATFVNVDDFRTHNQFYGAEVGGQGSFRFGNVTLDVRAMLGLGETHSSVDITGSQVVTGPAGTQTFIGGLLAAPTNIGRHTRNRFSVVPEVTVDLGYQLTDWLRVYVGYDFIYWTNVLRPGEQVDTVIDIAQVPNLAPAGVAPTGAARPGVLLRESDFWAQGVHFGAEVRY